MCDVVKVFVVGKTKIIGVGVLVVAYGEASNCWIIIDLCMSESSQNFNFPQCFENIFLSNLEEEVLIIGGRRGCFVVTLQVLSLILITLLLTIVGNYSFIVV